MRWRNLWRRVRRHLAGELGSRLLEAGTQGREKARGCKTEAKSRGVARDSPDRPVPDLPNLRETRRGSCRGVLFGGSTSTIAWPTKCSRRNESFAYCACGRITNDCKAVDRGQAFCIRGVYAMGVWPDPSATRFRRFARLLRVSPPGRVAWRGAYRSRVRSGVFARETQMHIRPARSRSACDRTESR